MAYFRSPSAGHSRATPAVRTAVVAFFAVLLPCAAVVAVIVANRTRGPAAGVPAAGAVLSTAPTTQPPPPQSPPRPARTTPPGFATVSAIASPVPPRSTAPAAAAKPDDVGGPTAVIESTEVPPEVAEKMKQVLEATEQLDRTVFATEVEAQRYEEYFIRLWDEFRAVRDKLAVLERAAFETLTYAAPGVASNHDWGVTL